MNILELADVVPALNWYGAEQYQRSAAGWLYRVKRHVLKKINGKYRWSPVGVIEDGLTLAQLNERYPRLGGDVETVLAAAIAA